MGSEMCIRDRDWDGALDGDGAHDDARAGREVQRVHMGIRTVQRVRRVSARMWGGVQKALKWFRGEARAETGKVEREEAEGIRVDRDVTDGACTRGGVERVPSACATGVHMQEWDEGACSRTQCEAHSTLHVDGADTGGSGRDGAYAGTMGAESGKGSGHERMREGAQVRRAPRRSFVSLLRSRQPSHREN